MSSLHLSSTQLSLPDGAVNATGNISPIGVNDHSNYLKCSGFIVVSYRPGNLFIQNYYINIVDKLGGGTYEN